MVTCPYLEVKAHLYSDQLYGDHVRSSEMPQTDNSCPPLPKNPLYSTHVNTLTVQYFSGNHGNQTLRLGSIGFTLPYIYAPPLYVYLNLNVPTISHFSHHAERYVYLSGSTWDTRRERRPRTKGDIREERVAGINGSRRVTWSTGQERQTSKTVVNCT